MLVRHELDSLSAEQIAWAKSHDWFYCETLCGTGVHVRSLYRDALGRTGIEMRTFFNLRMLRFWAGY